MCVLFTLGSHTDTIKMIVNPSSDMNPFAKLEDRKKERKKERGEDERRFKSTYKVKVNIWKLIQVNYTSRTRIEKYMAG